VKITRLGLLTAAALALCACHHREITKTEREQAANMSSEADFAVTVREWSRAEGLYAKAAALCPDTGDYWVSLGIVRMRLNDHGGARSAYKSAITAYSDAFGRTPANAQNVIREAYVLVVIGRADEARSILDKARAKNPGDRVLRSFFENHGLDKMISDPGLKGLSP
jgi:Flp pilus assembly protein TadD